MSTPNPVVFTPLNKGLSWAPSTAGQGGVAIPAGETVTQFGIGIRADGDAAHSAGNYQWTIVVLAPATSESLAALNAALTKTLAAGNYWVAIDQSDSLGSAQATSSWSAEIPVSIPATIVQPASPTSFSAA